MIGDDLGGDVVTNHVEITPEQRDLYRIISIISATSGGLLNSCRGMQGKYVFKKYKYDPTDFSIDSGILCGLLLLIFSAYFYFTGH